MSIRAILVALLGLWLISSPAAASEKKKEGEEPAASHFDLAPVATPILVDGSVKNYVFVTIRIVMGEKADAKALRDKGPMFRDAAVRAAHRTPFNRLDSYNAIDEAWARAQLFKAFAPIAGPGQIKGVEIARQQPKNLVRTPKP